MANLFLQVCWLSSRLPVCIKAWKMTFDTCNSRYDKLCFQDLIWIDLLPLLLWIELKSTLRITKLKLQDDMSNTLNVSRYLVFIRVVLGFFWFSNTQSIDQPWNAKITIVTEFTKHLLLKNSFDKIHHFLFFFLSKKYNFWGGIVHLKHGEMFICTN